MSGILVQFRTEEKEKEEAVRICEELGITLQGYLRLCISRLVREQGVPFPMTLGGAGGEPQAEPAQMTESAPEPRTAPELATMTPPQADPAPETTPVHEPEPARGPRDFGITDMELD